VRSRRPAPGPSPKATDTVTINYTGTLLERRGLRHDSPPARQPMEIPLGKVIDGWTEGVQDS
jgi:FKBP-type peptidyl-prolyl cis-trans isomerase